MRGYWLKTLLLAAAIRLPIDGLAAPCPDKRCSVQSLVTREAEPAVIPPIPLPKPVIPPAIPKPIAPKPIPPPPRPAVPVPAPKPLEPGRPSSGTGLQCKRAPGDACPNITPFQKKEIEEIRIKGRDAQASLVATQTSNSAAKDVDTTIVSTKYDDWTDDQPKPPPLDADEREFLSLNGLNVPFTTQEKWIYSTTRNKPGVNTKDLDNIILETHTSTDDRVMVIGQSWNQNKDKAPLGEKARWSDMAMNDLKKAFGKANPPIKPEELRYMIRSSIETGSSAKSTQTYIKEAITRTNGDPSRVNTFRSDPQAPGITTDELAAYQLLAGSDHVHRVLLMLKDYPETMKNVRVESLSVTTRETEGADDLYNIVIKFTKLDNP